MKKPMLATDADLTKIQFPVMVQPKIDGVRALVMDGKLVGRSLKSFKNKHVTTLFSNPLFEGMDGEMIVGIDPKAPDLCRKTTSALNTLAGEPEVTFVVFDFIGTDLPYYKRLRILRDRVEQPIVTPGRNIHVVSSALIHTMKDLEDIIAAHIEMGFEGTMIKDPFAKYKNGRVTVNQGQMLRVKQYQDSEIVVTQVVEALINNNEAKINALGHTERSSHKENKVPAGMVGSIIGFDKSRNEEVTLGPGRMTHDERRYYWDNQDQIINKIVKYKYMPHGEKDKPRHATFQSFRMPEDMD